MVLVLVVCAGVVVVVLVVCAGAVFVVVVAVVAGVLVELHCLLTRLRAVSTPWLRLLRKEGLTELGRF